MSRRRRGQSWGLDVLLVVIVVLVLWYMGKIPQLPPMASVIPQAGQVATLIPQFIPLASPAATATASSSPSSGQPLGERTKTSGCASADSLPDPGCTPGAVFPDVTTKQVCTVGYSSQVRDVPSAVKSQVYSEYGIASHEPGQYQVDHLIPLELGGSNDIANLWPQPASPRPGFHEKDQLEDYLRQQVCDGSMSLQNAQSIVAHDWLTVYASMPK